jgi:hypothetical protein
MNSSLHVRDFQETEAVLRESTRKIKVLRPCFYVRLRVPDDVVREVDNPKELTKDILKFGISCDVDERDIQYIYKERDPDNGYMAYSFDCTSRKEASIVEKIMKVQFEDVTVLNAWEYVDVAGVAKKLGHSYVAGSYEDYADIGRMLFVHMVETAKLVFPGKFLGKFGTMYSVSRGTSMKMTGEGVPITSSDAARLGFRTPTIMWRAVDTDNSEQYIVVQPQDDTVGWRDVAFQDIPVFANMEDGDEKYQEIADDIECASVSDQAGKVLHDYATKLWMIPRDRIDEAFYTSYVNAPDAYDTYRKAERYMIMQTSTVHETCDAISRDLERMGSSWKSSKLRTHHAMLVAGDRLLHSSMTTEQTDAMRRREDVTVSIEAIEKACSGLRDSMDPDCLAAFNKVFEVKAKTTAFLLYRKVLLLAFGLSAERKSKKADRGGYRFIVVSARSYTSLIETYSPAILCNAAPG